MAKFNKKTDRDQKPIKRKNDGDYREREFSGDSDEKKKSNSYKAKRSFTRNKGIREKQKGAKSEPYRGFKSSKDSAGKPKSFKPGKNTAYEKPFEKREKRDYDKPFSRDTKTESYRGSKPGREEVDKSKTGYSRKNSSNERPFEKREKRNFDKHKEREGDSSFKRKPFSKDSENKRFKHKDFEEGKAFGKHERGERSFKKHDKKHDKKHGSQIKSKHDDGLIRLNKYLSNAGIASRREADNLIISGTVKVNGVVVDQLGYRIKPTDKVTYGDAAVKSERKVYLLLNKPKDYITTVDDPQQRKTVMDLIQGACKERVYPVGRLDRNTTGLLLMTNDGELTTKLTHPKFGIKKVYHVSLNKGLKAEDFSALVEGFELEDGFIKADDLAFVGEGKKEVGIEVHSGRNRIVRRMFEHLGYDVIKLDRVVFAGLTKKDLPRGKYRFLSPKEISFLQMIG